KAGEHRARLRADGPGAGGADADVPGWRRTARDGARPQHPGGPDRARPSDLQRAAGPGARGGGTGQDADRGADGPHDRACPDPDRRPAGGIPGRGLRTMIGRAALPTIAGGVQLAAAGVVLGRPDVGLALGFLSASVPTVAEALASLELVVWALVAASVAW